MITICPRLLLYTVPTKDASTHKKDDYGEVFAQNGYRVRKFQFVCLGHVILQLVIVSLDRIIAFKRCMEILNYLNRMRQFLIQSVQMVRQMVEGSKPFIWSAMEVDEESWQCIIMYGHGCHFQNLF